MFRFFVKKREGNHFILSEKTLRHMKVARVTNKEFICTYKSEFYKCILEDNMAKIIEKLNENHEFSGEVIIAASVIDIKRFEWMIQKAVELGATKIIPMITERVIKKTDGINSKKIERWNQIALNAAEQSFRNIVPQVYGLEKYDDVILNYKTIAHKFIAHEKSDNNVEAHFPTNSMFLIGPEGGFSNSEIIKATDEGFKIISLGQRILRAETAPLFILSNIR